MPPCSICRDGGRDAVLNPTPAPSKDIGLQTSLPCLGWWEVGQPQMPGSSPHWSFLYSHYGLSVSVALMRRSKCGANVFIKATSSHQLPSWGWNLSLSLVSKDHSWEGPSRLEVEEKEEEGGWVRRIGRGRREPEKLGERGQREPCSAQAGAAGHPT